MTVSQKPPESVIIDAIAGLCRAEAVKALSAALAQVVTDLSQDALPGDVAQTRPAVPVKRKNALRFQPVWHYLETVEEYTTLKELREQLIRQFGETGTPSKSHLHRYMQAHQVARG